MQSRLDPERERVLIKEARRDPEAFRKLYDYYFPKVYAYIGYRVGRVQDIEDLTSETFLKAIERLDGFACRGEGSFSAWLFRIAHNVVNDFYRRDQRAEESVPLEDLPELEANSRSPAEALLRKERFALLRRLIGTLPRRRQEVITLKFFGGLRNREIAEVLGLDERTVASHLCRGLEDLHHRYVDELMRTKEGR